MDRAALVTSSGNVFEQKSSKVNELTPELFIKIMHEARDNKTTRERGKTRVNVFFLRHRFSIWNADLLEQIHECLMEVDDDRVEISGHGRESEWFKDDPYVSVRFDFTDDASDIVLFDN